MIRYAVRAVPWSRCLVGMALLVVLMECVRRWPTEVWLLQPAAVGLLAGIAAWAQDEPAAAVVDPSPRSLTWRTAARAPALLLLTALWTSLVLHSTSSLHGHAAAVLVQGCAAIALGAAWAGVQRARGVASPGVAFAAAELPVCMALGVLSSFVDWPPLFAHVAASGAAWSELARVWAIGAIAALMVLAAALADARWWGLRISSRGRRPAGLPRAG